MKKLLSLIVAIALLNLPVSAFSGEIIGIKDNFGFGGYSINGGEINKNKTVHDFAGLYSIKPASKYFLPFNTNEFQWEDAKLPLTKSTIKNLGLSLNKDYINGDNVFDSIEITEQNGNSGILIDFVDTLESIEKEIFEVDVQVLVFDEGFKNGKFKIKGSLSNGKVGVTSNTKACVLGEGKYAQGLDDVKNVKFEIGEGASILSNIMYDQKFYASAKITNDEFDNAYFKKYPNIVKALRVHTIGITGKIKFESPQLMQVYDDTMVHLGTTNQALPLRDKYYFTK